MHSVSLNPVEIFQALAEKTRLRLLRLLASLDDQEACLCEFSDSLLEPEYNLSRHLKVLRQSGLLLARREGRWVYHRLSSAQGLQSVFDLVVTLPDADGVFGIDLVRFKHGINKRSSALCTKDGVANTRDR